MANPSVSTKRAPRTPGRPEEKDHVRTPHPEAPGRVEVRIVERKVRDLDRRNASPKPGEMSLQESVNWLGSALYAAADLSPDEVLPLLVRLPAALLFPRSKAEDGFTISTGPSNQYLNSHHTRYENVWGHTIGITVSCNCRSQDWVPII